MKKATSILITIIMFLSITALISTKGNETSDYPLGDLQLTIPSFVEYADVLYELGLFKGTEEGYELEKPVNRSEAISMVLRMIGEEKLAEDMDSIEIFDDVAEEHWAFKNIGYAAVNGYIHGKSETRFGPEDPVTGQEFTKMLLSAIAYQGITISDAYEAGIKYSLLSNKYSKKVVSINDYQLSRNDLVNICYAALSVKTPEGELLQDKLIKKGIIDKDHLEGLIIIEETPISEKDKSKFAWDLKEYMPKDKNYMFSPISIKMALAMATVGAEGETKDEILSTLKIDDLEEYNMFARKLIKDYSENEDVKLNIANSLWLNTDYYKGAEFNNDFKETISDYYNASMQNVNNKNAVKTINDWVSNKTNDKIKKIISDNEFLAYIINAIYFKGQWASQFNESATEKDEFIDRNNNKSQIDFMNLTSTFNHYEDTDIQMISLPYQDRKTSMYIIIPNNENYTEDIQEKIEKMKYKRVRLSLPKFKTEFNIELKEVLSQMGVNTAFEPGKADFKTMFKNISESIFISDIIHKTYINVDENGTEAAAVTAIGFETTSAITEEPIVFKANKPFLYFIYDNVNNEILFMGEYAYTE